jgi:hypothetical protein
VCVHCAIGAWAGVGRACLRSEGRAQAGREEMQAGRQEKGAGATEMAATGVCTAKGAGWLLSATGTQSVTAAGGGSSDGMALLCLSCGCNGRVHRQV